MASTPCTRCLLRPEVKGFSSRWIFQDARQLIPLSSSFSTSASWQVSIGQKKKSVVAVGRRDRQSFKLKKKGKGTASGSSSNTPRPGERKAMRKRIVLSNTSALEVPGLEDMNVENTRDTQRVGSVVAIPGNIVDQLRAAEAFKKPQSWSFFRKPSMLIRRETVELAQEMDSAGKKTLRRIFVGDRGSGKSLLLLQAMALAFQKGWIVVSFPEAQYIVDGTSDYRPASNTNPLLFDQGQYSMETLRRIIASNPNLKSVTVKLQHQIPATLPSKATLFDLCDLGVEEAEIAPTVLAAFFKELDAPGGPPTLIAMDGLGYAMRNSNYSTATYEPVHAHRLTIIDWFMSHLSGEKTLPNGGMVLASTSTSNDPKVESLRFRLRQLEVKQALEKGFPNPDANAALPDPTLPFLLATGQQPNPVPQPDPYYKYDENVFKVLGSPVGVVAGNKTSDENEVVIRSLKGMSKEEARGLMEYWAKSGMMRQEVSDRLVSEKWSIAGGGVVGELERSCIRFRL